MYPLKIIAFSYRNIGISRLSKLYIGKSLLKKHLARLFAAKTALGLDELMYLATCNRVEFIFSSAKKIDKSYLAAFLNAFKPSCANRRMIESALVFEEEDALKHLFRVASSLESMVVGEREIAAQVRAAYEQCCSLGFTGDLLRTVIKNTVEMAKSVYSQTAISKKPVSVVSLAYRKLKEFHINQDAKFLIIGSGKTNTSMAGYLKKHGFHNFAVFNRTLANAQKLARDLNGKALPLSALKSYKNGFDVIITCTSSPGYVITPGIYHGLVNNDPFRKLVIDLAVPPDFDRSITRSFSVNLVAINNLRSIARKNLKERRDEFESCEAIINGHLLNFRKVFRARQVALAMSSVPGKIKKIRATAMNEVFAKEISALDTSSKEVLDKVLLYMEKKYISVPMKMAKEVMM